MKKNVDAFLKNLTLEGKMNLDKLKEVIIYFIFKSSRHQLGRVKLTKLIYFADLLAYQRLGRMITGLTYVNYKHGPWSYTIQEVIPQIPEIQEQKTQTLKGEPFYKYTGTVKEYRLKYLSDREFKILEEINTKWGKISLKEILSEVYKSRILSVTPYGGKIDFKKIVTEKYRQLTKKYKVPIQQAEWNKEKSIQQIKDYKNSQPSVKTATKIHGM